MYTADLHCDTILLIWLSELNGKRLSLRENPGDGTKLHIDLGKLQAGGYALQNFALFTDLKMPLSALGGNAVSISEKMPAEGLSSIRSADGYVNPWVQVTEMIRVFREEMSANADMISQVRTWRDIEENRRNGRISALLTTEEGGIIGGDLNRLDDLFEAGVRMMTITWNYENELGFPNRLPDHVRDDFRQYFRFRPESGTGLTDFGKEAVYKMVSLGIIPDVSHLSDDGFYDVAGIAKGPFVASHSNARSLCGCSRNLTDDMIRIIGEHGGVIGLNYCPSFLMETDDEEKCFASCEMLAHHARHIMNVGGREVL